MEFKDQLSQVSSTVDLGAQTRVILLIPQVLLSTESVVSPRKIFSTVAKNEVKRE